MICPECLASKRFLKIVDSRQRKDGRTWRRYECRRCKARFTTYEELSIDGQMKVAAVHRRMEHR